MDPLGRQLGSDMAALEGVLHPPTALESLSIRSTSRDQGQVNNKIHASAFKGLRRYRLSETNGFVVV